MTMPFGRGWRVPSRHAGCRCARPSSAADAQREAAEDAPELVVLDLRIGQDHGLSLIPMFLSCDPQTKIVVLTGYGSIATAVEAVKAGALQYLTKPADADDILAAFFPQATEGRRHAASIDVTRSAGVGTHQQGAR